MSLSQSLDASTICAEITAPGRAAVSVMRLSGPLAFSIAEQLCVEKLSLPLEGMSPLLQKVRFQHRKTELDEGLVLLFRGPRSFTGEDVVEFQTHGSPAVVQDILQACMELGCRGALPGEFTRRAVVNGRLSLNQAAALGALIDSSSRASRLTALRGLRTRFSDELEELRGSLLQLAGTLVAAVDFPEEGIEEEASEKLRADFVRAHGALRNLLRRSCLKQDLTAERRVVCLGKPNAGKSSLFNAMLSEKRALVTPVAGTTRDFVSETRLVDGMAVTFVDTAGLRTETSDPIEVAGIEESKKQAERADLVLYCMDASVGWSDEDAEMIQQQSEKALIWAVWTKHDLVSPERLIELRSYLPSEMKLSTVSVFDKSSVDRLLTGLQQTLRLSTASELEGEFVVSRAQRLHLDCADKVFTELLENAKRGVGEEILMEDLNTVLTQISDCIGCIEKEDTIREVFEHFCVGK